MNIQTFKIFEEKINEIKFEIIDHGILTAGEEWSFQQITSPFNRLYFILDGHGSIENQNHRLELKKGHVYLVPAGTCYNYHTCHYLKKFYLHFQIQLIPGIDLFSRCMEAIDLDDLQTETDLLMKKLNSSAIDCLLQINALLFSVISRFMDKAQSMTTMDINYSGFKRQQSVITYIEKNLSASLKVREIAETVGKSYFSLSRDFKNDTGLGIKEYMEMLLMNKARRLLLTTDLRIKEISESLGFSDAYYFSKFFRSFEKTSPKEYRKRKTL